MPLPPAEMFGVSKACVAQNALLPKPARAVDMPDARKTEHQSVIYRRQNRLPRRLLDL